MGRPGAFGQVKVEIRVRCPSGSIEEDLELRGVVGAGDTHGEVVGL